MNKAGKLIGIAVAALGLCTAAFAADREQMNIGKLYLNDTEVTATAARLNSAGAALTAGQILVGNNTDSNAHAVTLTGAGAVSTNGSLGIKVNAIVSTNLAANTILAEDLAALSVDTAALTNGAVTSDKIAANTIKAEDIESLAVDNAAITNGAVTGGKIATDTVTAGNISNGNWIITGMSTAQVAHIEYLSGVVPWVEPTGVFVRAYGTVAHPFVGWAGGDSMPSNYISWCSLTNVLVTNGLAGSTCSVFVVGY